MSRRYLRALSLPLSSDSSTSASWISTGSAWNLARSALERLSSKGTTGVGLGVGAGVEVAVAVGATCTVAVGSGLGGGDSEQPASVAITKIDIIGRVKRVIIVNTSSWSVSSRFRLTLAKTVPKHWSLDYRRSNSSSTVHRALSLQSSSSM